MNVSRVLNAVGVPLMVVGAALNALALGSIVWYGITGVETMHDAPLVGLMGVFVCGIAAVSLMIAYDLDN
jgi:hypothetical protein